MAALLWPTPAVVGAQGHTEGTVTARAQPSQHLDAVRPTVDAVTFARPQPLTEVGIAASAVPFDPFFGVVPPPPPAVAVAPPVAVVAAPPPPPPQEYRFLGRMTGPDGVEQILLTRGETPVSIKVGTMLDNGYAVESISGDLVSLGYAPRGAKASIPIPAQSSP